MRRIEKDLLALKQRLGPDVDVSATTYTYECRGGWDREGWVVRATREIDEGEQSTVLAATGQPCMGWGGAGTGVIEDDLRSVIAAASDYLDKTEAEASRNALVDLLFFGGDA